MEKETTEFIEKILFDYDLVETNKDCDDMIRGALMEAVKYMPVHTIDISIVGGCLDDVKGLPKGWKYNLHDYDNE